MRHKSILHFLIPTFLSSAFYTLICKLSFISLLTLISSFVIMSKQELSNRTNIINEIVNQYVLIAYSLGALLCFFVFWTGDRALSTNRDFLFSHMHKTHLLDKESKNELWRGIASGFLICITVVSLLCLSNQLNFLGTFLLSATTSPIFLLFMANLFALVILVICEEYIFRHKILVTLYDRIGPWGSILFSSFLYIFIKAIQFDLVWMDYFSLFFMNLTVCFFYLKSNKAHRGISYIFSLYFFIHLVCGLPLWGNSTAGFFLLKDSKTAFSWITGGIHGPFAGFGLLCLLMFVSIAAYLSWRHQDKLEVESIDTVSDNQFKGK